MKLLAAWRRREAAARAASQAGSQLDAQPGAQLDQQVYRLPDPQPEAPLEPGTEPDPEREVDSLLDWLQAHGYLSEQRFVESRVHARAARQGVERIRQELARHGVALAPEQAAALRETEFARAQAVWQRKFGEVAGDARGRAAQARFLAARGFPADVVQRIVGGQDEF